VIKIELEHLRSEDNLDNVIQKNYVYTNAKETHFVIKVESYIKENDKETIGSKTFYRTNSKEAATTFIRGTQVGPEKEFIFEKALMLHYNEKEKLAYSELLGIFNSHTNYENYEEEENIIITHEKKKEYDTYEKKTKIVNGKLDSIKLKTDNGKYKFKLKEKKISEMHIRIDYQNYLKLNFNLENNELNLQTIKYYRDIRDGEEITEELILRKNKDNSISVLEDGKENRKYKEGIKQSKDHHSNEIIKNAVFSPLKLKNLDWVNVVNTETYHIELGNYNIPFKKILEEIIQEIKFEPIKSFYKAIAEEKEIITKKEEEKLLNNGNVNANNIDKVVSDAKKIQDQQKAKSDEKNVSLKFNILDWSWTRIVPKNGFEHKLYNWWNQ